MGVESERFLPEETTPPWIRAEHMARFEFASEFVKGATVLDCACGSGVGSHSSAIRTRRESSRWIWK